jgi:hypothetical protein
MNNNFNSIERHLSKIFILTPRLKKIIKIIYQYLNWLLHRKNYKLNSQYPIKEFCPEFETFFGYYDKSLVNHSQDYVLYHLTSYLTTSKPHTNMPIKIVIQDIATNNILFEYQSNTYNWQQGCRAQWLTDDLFIFNDFDSVHKKYISRVCSVSKQQEIAVFGYPIQDAYHTDYFLSLNYQRLMTLRPDYGYRNLPLLDKIALKDTDNDGIWKIDCQTSNHTLLVSLSAMCSIDPNKQIRDAFNKVNHIMISPSGKQFIFLHRYYLGKRRFDRLFLADASSGKLKLLADYGMVSHCFWVDNKTILGYLRGPNGKDVYWLIDIETDKFTHVLGGKLDKFGDGHPHVHGDWFVTDTYPDKARMQHLILVNWKTREVKELGEFFHGFKYSGETRCDLHPRFSVDGKSIFFDSVFSGKRHLYKMDII